MRNPLALRLMAGGGSQLPPPPPGVRWWVVRTTPAPRCWEGVCLDPPHPPLAGSKNSKEFSSSALKMNKKTRVFIIFECVALFFDALEFSNYEMFKNLKNESF